MAEFIRGCLPQADSRVTCTHRLVPPQEIIERGGHRYCMHAHWHRSGWFCRHFAIPDPDLISIGPDAFVKLAFEDQGNNLHVLILAFRIAGDDRGRRVVPLHFRSMTGREGELFALRLSADDAEKFADLIEHGALDFMIDFPDLDAGVGKAVAQRLGEMVFAIRVIERGW